MGMAAPAGRVCQTCGNVRCRMALCAELGLPQIRFLCASSQQEVFVLPAALAGNAGGSEGDLGSRASFILTAWAAQQVVATAHA